MHLLETTPKDLEARMNDHMRLAVMTDCFEVMEMHHDLAMFYRDRVRSSILAEWAARPSNKHNALASACY